MDLLGSALGSIWLMCLGTVLAASIKTRDAFDAVKAINIAGDKVFSGFGAVVLIFSAFGLISVMAVNRYGGSLTLISASDSVRPVKATLGVRVTTIVLTAALSLVGALAASENFLANFQLREFPAADPVLLHPVDSGQPGRLLPGPPWPLRDRRDFQPAGSLRSLGWRRITSYPVDFLAMVPFFSTGLFTGFVAKALDGADISLFIGLPVVGILYYALGRSIDLEAEIALERAEAQELLAADVRS